MVLHKITTTALYTDDQRGDIRDRNPYKHEWLDSENKKVHLSCKCMHGQLEKIMKCNLIQKTKLQKPNVFYYSILQ